MYTTVEFDKTRCSCAWKNVHKTIPRIMGCGGGLRAVGWGGDGWWVGMGVVGMGVVGFFSPSSNDIIIETTIAVNFCLSNRIR